MVSAAGGIYEVDPLVCPKCGSTMKVIAVLDILLHLVKIGRSLPGFNLAFLA